MNGPRRTPVVAAIGPSSIAQVVRHLGIRAEDYEARICVVAQRLARWPMTLTVNADSESTASFAQRFLIAGGRHVRLLTSTVGLRAWPAETTELVRLPAKQIPYSLVGLADVILCLGMGTGTALEVCLAKFESEAIVAVMTELVSCRLPRECDFKRLVYLDEMSQLDALLGDALRRAGAAGGPMRVGEVAQ